MIYVRHKYNTYKMKRILYMFVIATMVMTTVSCGNDDDVSENNDINQSLVGTLWVGRYPEKREEGCALRFVSDAAVYVIDWEDAYPGDEADSTLCTYSYLYPKGTIEAPSATVTFIVGGNTLQVDALGDLYILTRVK